MIYALSLFFTVGVAGGFLSGLLGIGGGVIIVPLLTLAFTLLGVEPDQIYRLAIGTSLASIIFTSLSSFWAHNKVLPLRWEVVKWMAPWLVIGTFLGSSIATRINPIFLQLFFTLFIFTLAAHMLLNLKIKPREKPFSKILTGTAGMTIGVISSMVGIGGGTMIVPYLNWNAITLHAAIGISAILGFFISTSGTIGYIMHGLTQADLPWGTLGYVYLPALIAIMIPASLSATLGAKVAHKLSVAQLKLVFSCAMIAIGASMISSLISEYL